MSKITINSIYGEEIPGNLLFVVTEIDGDDHEDTKTQVWAAKDAEHLRKMVKEHYTGVSEDLLKEDDNEEHPSANQFDDDWGFEILYNEIGKIDTVQETTT